MHCTSCMLSIARERLLYHVLLYELTRMFKQALESHACCSSASRWCAIVHLSLDWNYLLSVMPHKSAAVTHKTIFIVVRLYNVVRVLLWIAVIIINVCSFLQVLSWKHPTCWNLKGIEKAHQVGLFIYAEAQFSAIWPIYGLILRRFSVLNLNIVSEIAWN